MSLRSRAQSVIQSLVLIMVMSPPLSTSMTTILVLVESSFMAVHCLVERLFSVFVRILVIQLLYSRLLARRHCLLLRPFVMVDLQRSCVPFIMEHVLLCCFSDVVVAQVLDELGLQMADELSGTIVSLEISVAKICGIWRLLAIISFLVDGRIYYV